LEYIEKYKTSLEKSFKKTLGKASIKRGEIISQSYDYCKYAIFNHSLADLILKKNYPRNISLRKRNAFRVAFGLLKNGYSIRDTIYAAGGLLDRYLKDLLRKYRNIKVDDIIDKTDRTTFLSIKYSYPKIIVEKLVKLLGVDEAEKIIRKDSNPVEWIRVNTLKIDVDKAIKKLEKEEVVVEKDDDFPELYKVIKSKKPLSSLRIVKDFKIVIHDKGSIAVVHALNPREEEIIIDAAAAPGMKTSLIAQLTNNRSFIIAVDISRNRIYEMRNVLEKMGVRNVEIILGDSSKLYWRSGEKILIDAPCSNSGAIGRDPALRLILKDERNVLKHVDIQWKILSNFIARSPINLKYIVYSVCSYLPEEGEEIVKKAVEKYRVRLVKPNILGIDGYRKYIFKNYVKRLFPHINSSTGFFIACIEK
ncbi:MAG TPA: RsmB/NOP family class I SAM-dependent RNA methyltransferase, partial [Thermoprotei archaeon]|nr:RsmB/NOP family class I SAM-dependent RNA methyltransferase [Thermoprotei archaeon]